MCCRTPEVREAIVETYELRPEAHVRLLKGQSKISCTGDPLTDSYYYFTYRSRETPADEGYFVCGYFAAEHFLQLLALPKLPLFDPLKSLKTESAEPNADKDDVPSSRPAWNPEMKQLHDAVNLLIIAWAALDGPLIDVNRRVNANRTHKPFTWLIKSVNTMIRTGEKGKKTLPQKIEELSKENDLRRFDFDLLDARLRAQKIPSYFGAHLPT